VTGKGVTVKHLIKFEVGETYKNRKGTYEVLEIAGDNMRIRWGAGEEVDTTVTLQRRILVNVKRELEHPSHMNVPSPRIEKPVTYRRRWSQLS
jgi:hypothetical protein